MPIYNEVWDDMDYQFRSKLNLKTLPRNHLMKLESLKFDFVEYKANQLVSCHIYERMMTHCQNQYGTIDAYQRLECQDAKNFFNICVQLNAGYGHIKKYFPETLVRDPNSKQNVHFDQLNL